MQISVRELSKDYLLKCALNKVSVEFEQGKIHALVGENGAGKSTLAGIISGNIKATGGQVFIDGNEVCFKNTRDALHKGIVLVHQIPLLSSTLTVKENLTLLLQTDAEKKLSSRFFLSAPSSRLINLKDKWVPELNLNSYVMDLGGNYRFYVSLLGALLRNPKCLILDEPSAFLDKEERTVLYENLKELCSTGVSVIVITHSTAEATTYADTVTVLKNGNLSAHFNSAAAYKKALELQNIGQLSLSAGTVTSAEVSADSSSETAGKAKYSAPCFSLLHASSKPKNKPALLDATITAYYGEITAVTGLKEAALFTLEDLITGMETNYTKGSAIFWDFKNENISRDLDLKKGKLTSEFLRKHNTAIVPSDKTFRASNPELTVEQMLCVYSKHPSYDHALKLIEEADVSITPDQKVNALSGGMLQRLILARELSVNPDFIILCNPMQGLDIASQKALCSKLLALAEKGKAVLIVGTMDFPLSLCSKVFTLEGGTTTLTFDSSNEGLGK